MVGIAILLVKLTKHTLYIWQQSACFVDAEVEKDTQKPKDSQAKERTIGQKRDTHIIIMQYKPVLPLRAIDEGRLETWRYIWVV